MFFILRRNSSQSLGAFAVSLLCIWAISRLQVPQLRKISTTLENPPLEQIKRELESETLNLSLAKGFPALGYDNLFADWIFLKFLQYFGDDWARDQTNYSLSPDYFEIILSRDPRFLEAYFFLSTSTSLYAGMPEKAIAIMEEGLQQLSAKVPPRSYYIWRYKGIDELLFLGDAQAARQSFERAANWASEYSDPESQYVADSSRQTAEFLARNPNSKSAQVAAWSMVLTNARDDRTRKIAIDRIRTLGGDVVSTPSGSYTIKLPQRD